MSHLWDNLFWGNHSADLANCHKARTQSPLSLCRFAKNYESTTAITSIVFHAIRRFGTNLNFSSLRGESTDSPKQSTFCRHTERSEVSKTREFKSQIHEMPQKRINESDSDLRHYDLSNLTPRDLDCFGYKLPRNDGVKTISESHNNKSHAQRLSLAF